ncbi:MAG: DUF3866 family protein [Coriobacteriales bacterium]|jgi:hypothetical protein|nr:DUF3866 family protein [Coriobacteriales bacterium]
MRLVWGTVLACEDERDGLQRLRTQYCYKNKQIEVPALNYLLLGAPCTVGEGVLLNVTAIDLGLGTGGFAFVVARAPEVAVARQDMELRVTQGAQGDGSPHPSCPTAFDDHAPNGGHIMKLRYTPLQREVLCVEESGSPYHKLLKDACSLEGSPVVCCELHSQVALVAAAVKHLKPQARVVYCMTDEAALLAPFSALLAQMRATGLLDACVTCGQALGGDFEAVNLYSGLLAAFAVCKADILICAQGPGVVGTATRFGHGGLAQAQALGAAAVLDGVPIAALRLSFADARPRHEGVSHHTLTALGTACLARAVIPFPADLSASQATTVGHQLEDAHITSQHGLVNVPVDRAAVDLRGLTVTTMGRTQDDDPAFFSAAFAAGLFAAQLLDERVRGE